MWDKRKGEKDTNEKNRNSGITGLVWAQPVADLLSTALVLLLYLTTVNRMQKESDSNGRSESVLGKE